MKQSFYTEEIGYCQECNNLVCKIFNKGNKKEILLECKDEHKILIEIDKDEIIVYTLKAKNKGVKS